METINIEKLTEINDVMDSSLSRESKIKKLLEICSNELIVNLFYKIDEFDENEKAIINKLKDYLSFYRLYRVNISELINRLYKINSLYSLFKSSDNEYLRADLLARCFKDLETFRKSYTEIRKHIDDPCLQIAREALENFDLIFNEYKEYEEQGKLDQARYHISYENYYKNYNYAKFVIEQYVEDDNSYKMTAFLYRFGIGKNTFNFLVHVIEESDPNLYEKYLERAKSNKEKNYNSNLQTIKGLAHGIETGLNNDGTKFTVLDFIKKVPFKNDPLFPNNLYRFMSIVEHGNMRERDEIMSYMRQNRINRYSLSGINVDKLCQEKQIINGVAILKEDIEIIIGFLKISKIPVNKKTYQEALKLYLNGEIDKEDVKAKMKEMGNKKVTPILSLKAQKKAA